MNYSLSKKTSYKRALSHWVNTHALQLFFCVSLVFFGFGHTSLAAQGKPIPDKEDESEVYERPTYEVYGRGPTCYKSVVTFSEVIRCETSATLHAEIDLKPNSLQDIHVIYYVNGEMHTATSDGSELIIKNLPLNAQIELFSYDDCGDIFSLLTFSTNTPVEPPTQIAISEKMAAVLKPYGTDVRGSLYDYVVNSREIGKYEKMAFIQQFYYKGDALPSRFCDEIPPNPPTTTDSCICNRVIVANNSAFPSTLNSNGTISSEFTFYEKEDISNGKGVEAWRAEGNQGAAKYRHHWAEAWKKDKGVTNTQTASEIIPAGNTDNRGYSANQARLFYQIVCEGITVPPEECECEKTLNVSWHYNSLVRAEAKVLSGGWKIGPS